MQDDEIGPAAGTPVRMARNSFSGRRTITIVLCQHRRRVRRRRLVLLPVGPEPDEPSVDDGGTVIGHHGLYRARPRIGLVRVDANGVTEGDRVWPFAEIEAALRFGEE